MKKIVLTILLILVFGSYGYTITEDAEVKTFTNEKGLWGLKDSNGNVVVKAQYKKLIALGTSSYIVQKKGKFGLIDKNDNILVPIKYSHVSRMLGKFLRIGNGSKYALYNEKGEELLKMEYSTIDILFGGMFLTCKNYKYGLVDHNGKVILDNVFDDIYMPKANIMRLKYLGEWYEIEQVKAETFRLPEDMKNIKANKNYIVTKLAENPTVAVGYSAVTFTDYLLKIFSSISPAHEQTIDNLMLLQGADAVSIYLKLSWIPKYPFVFAKNYYNTLKNPNNGPLSEVKASLMNKVKKKN